MIGLDDQLLADVAKALGISTKKGTVNAAQCLIDTSALARMLRGDAEQYGWDRAAAAGLLATCPITELEFFHSARSAADRAQGIEDMCLLFGWVLVDDCAHERAWRVQEVLTQRGKHRSAGAVDLVVAATAQLQGLTLLHRDRDFECIAAVAGQALQWYGPEAGKSTMTPPGVTPLSAPRRGRGTG